MKLCEISEDDSDIRSEDERKEFWYRKCVSAKKEMLLELNEILEQVLATKTELDSQPSFQLVQLMFQLVDGVYLPETSLFKLPPIIEDFIELFFNQCPPLLRKRWKILLHCVKQLESLLDGGVFR